MATDTVKYFSGTTAVAYAGVVRNEKHAEMFPGVKGYRSDSFFKVIGKNQAGEVMPVTRVIFFKRNPSLHKCGARCLHATGKTCECSCGGANHGAGG